MSRKSGPDRHGRSLAISSHVNLVFVRYFDEMYVFFPLVVLCERRLHDTSPLFGPRGRHWKVIIDDGLLE